MKTRYTPELSREVIVRYSRHNHCYNCYFFAFVQVVNYSDNRKSLKLADFGLATEVQSPLFLVCGTPTYVAPEILDESGYVVL